MILVVLIGMLVVFVVMFLKNVFMNIFVLMVDKVVVVNY